MCKGPEFRDLRTKAMAITFQMLVRGLDGRTSCLRFPSSAIAGSLLQEHISTILRIPAEALLILTGTRIIHPHASVYASSDGFFPSCNLLLRLRGGKGGFGSLLRGAATKGGQKKTSNFDACRDMSGRRLRHVNAEKRLKEWRAQAKERELEKTAYEFLKKQIKKKEDDSGCSEVIDRFREESSKARDDVESVVARGLAEAKKLGKRKVVDGSLMPSTSSKRSHIWVGREIDAFEEDSEDDKGGSEVEDDEDEDGGEDSEIEDTKKGIEGSSGPNEEDGAKQGSEVEDDAKKCFNDKITLSHDELKEEGWYKCEKDEARVEDKEGCNGLNTGHSEKKMPTFEVVGCGRYHTASMHDSLDFDIQKHLSPCEGKIQLATNAVQSCEKSSSESGSSCEPTNTTTVNVETKDNLVQSKLNLEDYLQASNLEVLGLERLKQELQARGLKCGGSLAERAERLFLLKTLSLEQLDKRHFAKTRLSAQS